MTSPTLLNAAALVGRLLLAFMFIQAGYGKIGGFAGTQQYMAAAGVPGLLLPLVIAAAFLYRRQQALPAEDRLKYC